MTVWRSLPVGMTWRCGRCDRALEPGARVCLLHVPGVRRVLVRCVHCAEAAAPADDADAIRI